MSQVIWRDQGDLVNSDLQLLDCTQVYNTDVQYVGSPYLGDYTKAEIQIYGPLIQTTLNALNYNVPEEQYRDLMLGGLRFNPQLEADYDYSSDSNLQITSEMDIQVLPITIQASAVLNVLGLALMPVKAASDHTYERIGLVVLTVVEPVVEPAQQHWLRPITEAKFRHAQAKIISYFRALPPSEIVLI